MPALSAVLATIQAQVSIVTTGLVSAAAATSGQSLTVKAAIGWPPLKTLQDNVQGLSAVVGIMDRGLATNTTRWRSVELMRTVIPAGLTVTPAARLIYQSAATLVIGGAVVPGDALGIAVTSSAGTSTGGTVILAGLTDTPTTIAATAAAQINADAFLRTLLHATSAGPVITLTPFTGAAISVAAHTGNAATRVREIGRRCRHIQVTAWVRTDADRSVVTDPIEAMIATMEGDFGLAFPDGTLGRVAFTGDGLHDDATLSDTYCRSMMLSVDYPITTTDSLYAVLVPIAAFATF